MIYQSGVITTKNLQPGLVHSSTVQFKGGLVSDGGAVSGQSVKQRLETCYVNLSEALFSSGRYTEATANFALALGVYLRPLCFRILYLVYWRWCVPSSVMF